MSDIATMTDAQLIAERNHLKELWHNNQMALNKDPANSKLAAEENAIKARMERIETRISFRMREGQPV